MDQSPLFSCFISHSISYQRFTAFFLLPSVQTVVAYILRGDKEGLNGDKGFYFLAVQPLVCGLGNGLADGDGRLCSRTFQYGVLKKLLPTGKWHPPNRLIRLFPSSSPLQIPLHILSGVRLGTPGYLLGSSAGHHGSSLVSAFGAHVDDIVRRNLPV